MKTYTRNEVIDLLRNNVLSLQYGKADGTIRDAKATLLPEHVPQKDRTEESIEKSRVFNESNPDVVTYWDLDANGFRRFKMDALVNESVVPLVGGAQ
jgi:hypothetical protein